jgi:hypothetical protein
MDDGGGEGGWWQVVRVGSGRLWDGKTAALGRGVPFHSRLEAFAENRFRFAVALTRNQCRASQTSHVSTERDLTAHTVIPLR